MATSKLVKTSEKIAQKVTTGFQGMSDGVTSGFQKMSDGVTSGFQKMCDTVVGGYTKIEDGFVDRYLTKDGETVEEAKARLQAQNKSTANK